MGRASQFMRDDTGREGWKKFTVGRECTGVQGRLRGGGSAAREGTKIRHQSGSDRIISITVGTEYSSRR